ncbi:MAG: redox-sensing transcriptional repressor Rex [Sedimentisphaerales bacterium]|nr:redox-sensing transcriptional repressor Rex [Sedimentisphaerales bacterium]
MTNRNCIIRLSRYKNSLLKLKSLGFMRVFSKNLADATGVTAAQVRKDFSIFGIRGNRRGGYQIDQLITQLRRILGKDKVHDFVLVGVGNLGKALLNYPGFEKSGIKIVAGFEIDSTQTNLEAKVPVLPLNEIEGYICEKQIRFGIISVPDFAAQQVCQIMVQSGIRGILNFAPIRLKVPDDCVIRHINLETELENIIYFVNASIKGEIQQ